MILTVVPDARITRKSREVEMKIILSPDEIVEIVKAHISHILLKPTDKEITVAGENDAEIISLNVEVTQKKKDPPKAPK